MKNRSDERWLDFEYILKIQSIGFPNIGLDWVSARGHFPPKRHLAMSRDISLGERGE